jgi:hypothetical protein
LPADETQSNFQPMRALKRRISASVAREIATKVTSRCARWIVMPSLWSAMNEQLGQPCSQPGPNMKCCTSSWRRPANSSASERGPAGVSNT